MSLLRENVTNALVMIQPALMMYTMDSDQAQPVLLDIDSMRDNVVLLLDAFFFVAVWKGQQIVDWENAKYHEQEEFANLRAILEVPIEDAEYIMQDRMPWPRFYVTKPSESNERKFLSKVNPSKVKMDVDAGSGDGKRNIFTEDVSLAVFMEHLVKMAVQS